MLADGQTVLNKVFAVGVGYPIRIKEGSKNVDQTEKTTTHVNPRADGFSLYMKSVGDIMIRNLLPKTQMHNMDHFKQID